ncbi:MAG: type IX secretion system membrane protein PorP/SprF [Cytophagales bacterium]|nr:type IX secretion system membrane protein PorP/SprF [Cytophagales bacterium]
MSTFFRTGLLGTLLLSALSLLPEAACSQDTREVPLGTLPMQYNGGFAGEAGDPRINTVAGVAFNTYLGNGHAAYISYDQFIPAIRSGVGITAGYTGSRFAGGYLGELLNVGHGPYLSLTVAPKLSLRGKVTISPFLDVSVYRGWGQNVFFNGQVDVIYKVNTVRSRAGLLLNTEKFYVGYSVHLVDQFMIHPKSDTALSFSTNRFEKFNSYWQLGYTFGHATESKFSFTPQVVFRLGTPRWYVGKGRTIFHPVDFHVNFRYKKAIWGVNLTGVHAGWQTDRLRIMLSDSLEYLYREGGYAANLALRYIFKE